MPDAPLRLLVVGDFMLDYYYWGRCERISPEAPVPIVEVERESHSLGGAGNVVKNLLALGVSVEACTILGDDPVGDRLLDAMQAQGIGTGCVLREAGRHTSIKSRLIAGHQQVIRFDQESRTSIRAELAEALLQAVADQLPHCQGLILSDYAKGVLTPDLTRSLIAHGRAAGVPVFVDPKGHDFSKYRGATLITPNRREVQLATGLPLIDEAALAEAATRLHHELQLEAVVITLSEAGIGCYDGEWQVVPTAAKAVFDVTGAGDTALAALAYAYLMQQPLREAAHFANAAAAVVISKLGSETATLTEIDQFLSSSSPGEP